VLSDDASSAMYEFAGYRLDPARRSLTHADGDSVKLMGRPYDTLVYLVQHAGEVVDRDAIVHAVWPRRVVEDNNLNQAIAVLRRLLGEHHIATVAGRGYQFVTPVHAVVVKSTGPRPEKSAQAPHGVDMRGDTSAAAGTAPEPFSPSRRRRFAWPWLANSMSATAGNRVPYAVTALAALAVAVIAFDHDGYAPRSSIGRIAILPCDDLSPDPKDSYFAVGMHDELLNRLGQIRSLRLRSGSSVLQYTDSRPPIPQIGADLGVDTIMECNVRYNRDQVTLNVQLIDVATDEHLWSQSYLRDVSNLHSLYEMQVDIATNVANALRVEIFDEELSRIKQPPTDSHEAYEFYLASVGARTNERKIELLERALELDPEFIDAWLQKAFLHMLIAGFMAGGESAAAHAAAFAAANRALALDPNSSRGHAILALYHGQIGDWTNSELEWRRAIALGGVRADLDNSLVMMSVGHADDAVAAMEATLARDPMNQLVASSLLIAYEVLGEKGERRRHWERGEELLGLWSGDFTESILRILEHDKEFLRAEVTPEIPAFYGAVWSEGVANLDSPADGLEAMRSLHANPDMLTADKLRLMTVWALHFGDPALALQWFRESVELQATGMLHAWLPAFADLRHEPGFKDLVRDQGLPEYWDRFGWPEFCRPGADHDFECD
jgi:DNA-binding winged helix-turn-helix (wHTH) protein/TolB-like protein